MVIASWLTYSARHKSFVSRIARIRELLNGRYL
jgi:hypothetical protein